MPEEASGLDIKNAQSEEEAKPEETDLKEGLEPGEKLKPGSNDTADSTAESIPEKTTHETTDEIADSTTDSTPEDTAETKDEETADSTPEEPEETTEDEKGIFDELYDTFFGKSWEMWIGCIILSVLSISLFMIASPWGSSGGLNNWGQNFYDILGLDLSESAPNGVTDIIDQRYGMLSITMIIGALGSALMGKEFAIRVAPKGELVKGLIGGIFMGIGAVLGMGCTVGGFYTGWPALSGGALVFALGLFVGVFMAVKYILWEMDAFPGISSGKSMIYLASPAKGTSWQPLAGVVVLVIGALLALLYDGGTEKALIGFVLIGLMIGVVLQRSRFCIVRTIRETFLSGDSEPTVAIIAGILVGMLGFTVIKIMEIGSETSGVSPNFWVPSLVGGIIFGIGMTIAGGCTVGATWRAGEGHVKLWLALVGIVFTMPLAGEYIKPGFLDMLPSSMNQSVFLPDTYGYVGAVCIMLLVLLLWYVFAKWNERTGKFAAF